MCLYVSSQVLPLVCHPSVCCVNTMMQLGFFEIKRESEILDLINSAWADNAVQVMRSLICFSLLCVSLHAHVDNVHMCVLVSEERGHSC